MEQETLYRKVSVKERLPNNDGNYICFKKHEGNISNDLRFHKEEFYDSEGYDIEDVEYWLEEINQPTESKEAVELKGGIQKCYTEIWKTQVYPMSTKGKNKADDIIKKYFPFVKP